MRDSDVTVMSFDRKDCLPMTSRASESEISPTLASERTRSIGEACPPNHEFNGHRDRRQQNRQQFRKTSLSSWPSLLSFRSAWVALDLIICLAAVILARIGNGSASLSIESVSPCIVAGLPFAISVLAMAQLAGLYRAGAGAPPFITLIRILEAVLAAGLSLHWLQKLWATEANSLELVGWKVVLTSSVMFCARLLWRQHRDHLCKRNIARKNFLIVGADKTGRDVRLYLSSLRHEGYCFQGFASMCEEGDVPKAESDTETICGIHDVIHLAQSKFVDEIIFSKRPATPGVLSSILRQAQPLGISIRLIPSLTETLIDRTDIEYIGELPTISVFSARQRPIALLLKRAIDLSVASAVSFALLPLFAAIAIAIKLQSHGPVLYLSKRVGHKGRVFTCYKFRTMVINAAAMQKKLEHRNERTGAFFKIADDPRVTATGRILRKYSLDELPQLWNVIRGDMSLVGPRPPLDSETAQYNLQQLRRLDAVPGITGLWQVKARRDPSFEQTVALDSSYINNWSLRMDLSILLQTIKVVFQGTGS
jgi:exopolysaccharide biosynthesis polyprenyl glycosylphosphotransferase